MNTASDARKLALGTVQFGITYGIANNSGQVKPREVCKILEFANSNAIQTLDTAIAYGESETVLGKQDLSDFSLITKLPAVPIDTSDIVSWVNHQLEGSLQRLNITAVDGLLLHRPAQLLEKFGGALYRQLENFKQQGLVKRIGISIYEPEELDLLCEHFHFDLIQAPFNIIDNRLCETGWLKRLSDMGTAVHVRSVFMQGLLLMSELQRPRKFSRWDGLWKAWDQWLKETQQTPLQACLRHALAVPEIEKVVVGVDSVTQLKQIIEASKGTCEPAPPGLLMTDKDLLNPSHWNVL
jgi:aryl-alcohol dehydrogenase-like predicted oxidoreductase